ncbi:MAG TPA: hypothetical protein VFU49_02440 [Ktedonobacteraceae bacterium]|nr:hypothetical protein [Ktedonobacteraceae bacterium]
MGEPEALHREKVNNVVLSEALSRKTHALAYYVEEGSLSLKSAVRKASFAQSLVKEGWHEEHDPPHRSPEDDTKAKLKDPDTAPDSLANTRSQE